MKRHWIVSWILNDWSHAKKFIDYEDALSFLRQLEKYGYNPSIHQG